MTKPMVTVLRAVLVLVALVLAAGSIVVALRLRGATAAEDRETKVPALVEGLHHLTGEAGWVDEDKATECFREGMENGDPRAGVMYAQMIGRLDKSVQEQKLGAELRGRFLPEAQRMAQTGDPYAKAVVAADLPSGDGRRAMLEDAAKQGIAYAQYQMTDRMWLGFSEEGDRMVVFWAEPAARQGHAEAAARLGFCYGNGLGVERDVQKSRQWFEAAFRRGSRLAVIFYTHDSGLPKDMRGAAELARKGGERGDPLYCDSLGMLYESALMRDDKKALFWYERATEKGLGFGLAACLMRCRPPDYARASRLLEERVKAEADMPASVRECAQAQLAYLCLKGLGMGRDEGRAVRLLESAAEHKYGRLAPLLLAYCYACGRGAPVNEERARELFDRLYTSFSLSSPPSPPSYASMFFWLHSGLGMGRAEAEQVVRPVAEVLAKAGSANAQHLLGFLCETAPGEGKDEAKAVEWYSAAAQQGHAGAQLSLGICELKGRGTPKDVASAMQWLHRAAERQAEDPIGKYAQALLYYHGLGVEMDAKKTAELLQLPNGVRYAPAEFMLADMYAHGEGGLDKDEVRALGLYESAAWGNMPEAAMKAAEYRNKGIGCERNMYEAADWYERAYVLSGDQEAQRMLEQLRTEYRKLYPGE